MALNCNTPDRLVTLGGALRRLILLCVGSALILALPVLLIALATWALGKAESLGPNYSGAAISGSIAGSLAGTLVSWVREVAARTNIIRLVRSLDHRAAAVGAALALAFSIPPTGTYKDHVTGIIIAVFTGMLTAAIIGKLIGHFGASLAGALKSAMVATVASAFAFLFGIYLAILADAFLLLAGGLAHFMASSTIGGAFSRALVLLEYGGILLISSIGIMAVGTITTLVTNSRAEMLIVMIGFVYAVLGYVLWIAAFPVLNSVNFEGAIAGCLAGILAGACVGLESKAFKGVTAGLIGGCLAGVLGSAVAPLSIRGLDRIVGGAFGGLGAVKNQLEPGVLGAVFGGVLGGFFPEYLQQETRRGLG